MRCFSFFCLFFFSCSSSHNTLPNSTGKNSEIIFVVNDNLWNKSIKVLAEKTFENTIIGLPQNESMFSVVQVNNKEFKSILRTHKNIIIISEEVTTQINKNKWANNQFVALLNWNNESDFFLKELKKLREIVSLKELSQTRQKLLIKSQKSIEKKIKKLFDIELVVPNEYSVVKIDSTLFWANYDPLNSDEIKNIILFSFNPDNTSLEKQILHKTDSVFKKYLQGEKKGSYVKIEETYPVHFSNNLYRGLWKLENGFMGGPFIAKTYIHRDKVIVNIGVVFAPQEPKRQHIKEFEAIL